MMITIEVLSPEKPVHRTNGVEVLIPTTVGQLGIRKGHRPLIAQLIPGTMVVKKEKGPDEVLATFGGFVEVFENAVIVMADSAELAEELDELKIQEAIHRAEDLKSDAKDTGELRAASALLAANLLRMKAVKRHRAHGKHHHS